VGGLNDQNRWQEQSDTGIASSDCILFYCSCVRVWKVCPCM